MKLTSLAEKYDEALRLAVVVLLLLWNTVEGAKFENEYPKGFIKLYPYPIWRVLLLLGVILGSMWHCDVGAMLAMGVFFYILDMEVTLENWAA